MLKKKLLVAALVSAVAVPAMAEEASPFSGNVSLTSNYLYRGISQTGAKPAIQGGFDFVSSSGPYVGVWGSSISWIGDSGLATSASTEIDTYFGYKSTFATDFSYDVGFLRYNYPGNYVPYSTTADTNEVYGSIGYSIVTLKYSYATGQTFGVSKAKGTNYIDLSANYTIPDTGVTLGAHYGKQTYKGATADALKLAGSDPTYSDYKVSVSKDFSGYVLALAYSKTNAKTGVGGFYYSLQNKDLGKGTAVLSLSHSM